MSAFNYFPILKTTSAELRAYAELPARVRDGILPLFELTRSRRSKNNPNGDVWKQIESIEESVGDRPFILDLTTEESLQNPQIENMLLTSENGFQTWIDFAKGIGDRGLHIIPVIHYDSEKLPDVKKQIRELKKISSTLAFRVAVDDDVAGYTQEIGKSHDLASLILILDARFIKEQNGNPFRTALDAIDVDDFKAVVCAASSFPSSVANYGDKSGDFPIAEVAVTEDLRSRYKIFHGDFGSIHPVRYEARFGGWVPRIDFPTADRFYYYRYRREEGGYAKAAQKVVRDQNYKPISEFRVWGDAEIAAASAGSPNGRSPAHWISARANLHMTRQYLRLRRYPTMTV